MVSGRMKALKKQMGERVDEPTPEGQLRKCIKMLSNLPDEDVDDLLIILDGVPVKDYVVIKRFACDMDRVADKWKEIIYLYDAWLRKEWSGGPLFRAKGNVPSELHHIPVTIDDRLSAMSRVAHRNEKRRGKPR